MSRGNDFCYKYIRKTNQKKEKKKKRKAQQKYKTFGITAGQYT